MAVTPGIWGIDIGQCALKAIRLEMIEGVPTATAFDYIEHPKILSQPDADPDTLTREALEKFLSRNPVKGDKVAIGVPGQSGLARFVKLPPVEEKKIGEIVKFEAKQQIPFPLEEVVWDFQKIGSGQVSDGFAIDTEIGLFAMKRDMISRFLSHFQQVGIEVHMVQMSPLALCNYVTYDLMPEGAGKDERGKKKCIVALDLGTDNSNLIITDADKIIWQRPIPLGGNHFTRALTKEMKLTFAKAEHVKRNAGKSPDLPNILKALRPVLSDFVGEVQRSLGYFTNTHRDAAVYYMVGIGSGFKLPGMQKYLAEKLNLEVRKPAKFERMTGDSVSSAPAFIENMLSFPVAYGLAIQGLQLAKLTTNLLPPEIHRERLIRGKKPWAVAAAAMLLLGVGIAAFGFSVPFAQAQAKVIQDAIVVGKAAKDEATQNNKKIDDSVKDVGDTTNKVKSVISGQDERRNWIKFYKFLDDVLPIPGPNGNLLDASKQQPMLWQTELGGQATARYLDRLRNGMALTASIDEAYREYLPAVDVEAINTRYTPNLRGAYDTMEQWLAKIGRNSKSYIWDGDEYAPDQWKDKPTGAGWLVEIRGTTSYNTSNIGTREFLKKALVWNIVRMSRKTGTDAKPGGDIEPILGNISHVFLYNFWVDKMPDPDKFRVIGTSLVDLLATATPEMSDAPAGATVPAPGGESAPILGVSDWVALTSGSTPVTGSSSGTGGGSGAGAGGAPPGGGRSGMEGRGRPPGGGRGAPGGVNAGGGGSGAPADTGNNPYAAPDILAAPAAGTTVTPNTNPDGTPMKTKPVKPRYEFVVVFVWKEPTPSDALIAPSAAADPAGLAPKR